MFKFYELSVNAMNDEHTTDRLLPVNRYYAFKPQYRCTVFYSTITTTISITLVFVGPVITCPPAFLKKLYESNSRRYFAGSIFFESASGKVSESTTAPAASVGPSFPSVPADRIVIPGCVFKHYRTQ